MEEQRRDIVLDASQIPFIDSEGLELLLEVHEGLQAQGKILKIVGLNETCLDIFTATQLQMVFSIHETINDLVRGDR